MRSLSTWKIRRSGFQINRMTLVAATMRKKCFEFQGVEKNQTGTCKIFKGVEKFHDLLSNLRVSSFEDYSPSLTLELGFAYLFESHIEYQFHCLSCVAACSRSLHPNFFLSFDLLSF